MKSVMPVLQQDQVWKMLLLPSQSFHLPFGFSSVSYLCCGSLVGITHHPTVTASSCRTAGKGSPLASDEQSMSHLDSEGSWAIQHRCSQPSDGGVLWGYMERLPWIQLFCCQTFHFKSVATGFASPTGFPFQESFLAFGNYLLNSLLPESSQRRGFSRGLQAR